MLWREDKPVPKIFEVRIKKRALRLSASHHNPLQVLGQLPANNKELKDKLFDKGVLWTIPY